MHLRMFNQEHAQKIVLKIALVHNCITLQTVEWLWVCLAPNHQGRGHEGHHMTTRSYKKGSIYNGE
jgi:hypothetical protein